MDYRGMSDEELYRQIESIDLADKFLDSPQGKLIHEAANRIIERATFEISVHGVEMMENNKAKLIELILIIKKYKFGLFEEIKQISREGYLVYEELKNRHPQPENEETGNTPEQGDTI